MPQIIVDPDKMRQFERALRELAGEFAASRQALNQKIDDVKQFWKDEKYQAFVRKQESLAIEMQMFERTAAIYCDYLQKKAIAADAYLGR